MLYNSNEDIFIISPMLSIVTQPTDGLHYFACTGNKNGIENLIESSPDALNSRNNVRILYLKRYADNFY